MSSAIELAHLIVKHGTKILEESSNESADSWSDKKTALKKMQSPSHLRQKALKRQKQKSAQVKAAWKNSGLQRPAKSLSEDGDSTHSSIDGIEDRIRQLQMRSINFKNITDPKKKKQAKIEYSREMSKLIHKKWEIQQQEKKKNLSEDIDADIEKAQKEYDAIKSYPKSKYGTLIRARALRLQKLRDQKRVASKSETLKEAANERPGRYQIVVPSRYGNPGRGKMDCLIEIDERADENQIYLAYPKDNHAKLLVQRFLPDGMVMLHLTNNPRRGTRPIEPPLWLNNKKVLDQIDRWLDLDPLM